MSSKFQPKARTSICLENDPGCPNLPDPRFRPKVVSGTPVIPIASGSPVSDIPEMVGSARSEKFGPAEQAVGTFLSNTRLGNPCPRKMTRAVKALEGAELLRVTRLPGETSVAHVPTATPPPLKANSLQFPATGNRP